MFTRILSSATVGMAVTTGLLFLMQYLIATGEEILTEPRIRHDLNLIRVKEKEVVKRRPNIPKRIDRPKTPPKTVFPKSARRGEIGIKPPGTYVPRPTGGPTFNRLNFSDGPLVSIIKVRPQYPTRAAANGLEGTVLLQFDVTTLGAVENVIVIESSNSVFDKAAIAAAYRFKYKPGVVDGIPYATKGLRNLFRFEIEK